MHIGLTQRVLLHNIRAYDSLEHSWYRFLKDHTLCPIANRPNQNWQQLAQNLDALIITGGDDSTVRRATEIPLAKHMWQTQKPVIGICHGAFLLTDLLGGTVTEIDNHANTEHMVWYFGEPKLVNSYHSLAIKQLHAGATALVNDSDGNIEAWIDGTLAGIVWHPERQLVPWMPDEIQSLLERKS